MTNPNGPLPEGRPPSRLRRIRSRVVGASYWVSAQRETIRDERLSPDMPSAFAVRYILALVGSLVFGFVYAPARHKGLGMFVTLLVGAGACAIVERDRRKHSRMAHRHENVMPPDWPMSDGFYVLPMLLKTDAGILSIQRRHLITLVTRSLVIIGLFLITFGFWALAPSGLKWKVLVFLICFVISWYLQATWRRSLVVLTEDRLIFVDDPPVPLPDNAEGWSLSDITATETEKPTWAQLLPGTEPAIRVKFRVYGSTQVTLPLIRDGEVFFAELLEAIQTYKGHGGPDPNRKKELDDNER